MKQIQKERCESLGMIWQLARAVRQLRKMGVMVEVAFEWPRTASGWKHPDVKKMLDDMKLEHECNFDGCRYQLTEVDGLPVMKQWRVRTTLKILSEPLSRRCERDHRHGQCRVRMAVQSGTYTDILMDIIGKAIARAARTSAR